MCRNRPDHGRRRRDGRCDTLSLISWSSFRFQRGTTSRTELQAKRPSATSTRRCKVLWTCPRADESPRAMMPPTDAQPMPAAAISTSSSQSSERPPVGFQRQQADVSVSSHHCISLLPVLQCTRTENSRWVECEASAAPTESFQDQTGRQVASRKLARRGAICCTFPHRHTGKVFQVY